MVSIVTSILFPCSVLTLTLEVAEWCEVWIGEEGGGEDEEELVEGVRTVVPLAGITRRERRGRGGREGERGREREGERGREKEGGGGWEGREAVSCKLALNHTNTSFTTIPKI